MNVAVLLGLFNTNLATGYILAVEAIYRHFGLTLLGHFDKAKTLGAISLFVYYQVAGLHCAVGLEQSPKL
jgi:hypothetical protein